MKTRGLCDGQNSASGTGDQDGDILGYGGLGCLGVGNIGMGSAFSWDGPESGLVLPTSSGADHRGHEVLSVRSKEAKSPACGDQ